MPSAATTHSEPSPRCQQALREIDCRIDAGQTVDRAAFLDHYADVAAELAAHLELADVLRELSPSLPDAGTRIHSFGDFEVLEELGRGGMAVVYKARQKSLDRLVALKFPIGGALSGAEAVDRFRQEALALARLRHPHVVAIHEVGQHAGRTFLSMEYVDGVNLAQLLRDEPPSIRQSVEYVRMIANAVDHAHQHGIVHRDLKPANILLDRSGVIRVADFGLGKVLDSEHSLSLTQTGQILGTLRYLSPEHADGDGGRLPEAGDIYAIGAILYELLSGRPAFWANSTGALIRQIFEQEPVPLCRLDPRIPPDLDTICLKCLRKHPAERYPTAGALADDLQRFLDGRPVAARPISTLEKLWRWCRRRPLLAGLGAVTTAAILAAIFVSGYFWRMAVRDREDAIAAQQLADTNELAAQHQEQLAKAELARSELLLYASQISRAQQAWDDADVPAVWETLSACKPERRGWEHDYLFTQLTGNQRTLRGHTQRVTGVAFTPDGRRLVSASWDDALKVWDVATGRELRTILAHVEGVESIDISPDGRRLLSAGRDNAARIWDLETGHELVAFKKHTGYVMSAKFTPDVTRVVSGGRDDVIRIWDASTGEEYWILSGHTNDVDSVAVHPGGRWVASGGSDRTVRLWDMETGVVLDTLAFDHDVSSVAFSSDGTYLAAGTRDTAAWVWKLSGVKVNEPAYELRGHRNSISQIAWVTGLANLVSCSYDGTLKVWSDLFRFPVRTLKGHLQGVFCAATNHDATRIASGGEDTTIKLWDLPRNDPESTYQGHSRYVTCLALTNDAQRILSGSDDRTLNLWDLRTHQHLATFTGHSAAVTGVALSPDQTWFASSHADGTVRTWDMATGNTRLTLIRDRGAVHCVAVTPDGLRILSGGEDPTVRVWDVQTGEELAALTGHEHAVTCLALSPDGERFCTGSADRYVKLWDLKTGRVLLTLTGHTDRIRSVAFDPDGGRIISAGDDRLLKLWDAASGTELRTFRGHSDKISGAVFSPDGSRIASVSHDHTLRLWDTASGQELLSLERDKAAVRCVRFTPDGTRIVTGGEAGKLELWDASTHYTDAARP